MAESRPLPCNFWSWPSISNLLLEQKAILAYLWTSRFSTAAGGFELPTRLAAAELGLTEQVLMEALRQFKSLDLIEFDVSTCEVFIKGWFRWHKFNTTPQIINFIRAKQKILSCKILKLVVDSSTAAGVPQTTKILKKHNPTSQRQHQHQHQHQQNLEDDEVERIKRIGVELYLKKIKS